MRWQQGRNLIDGMLSRGELERVPASRPHADLLIAQSKRHLDSAGVSAQLDPPLGSIIRPFDRLRRRRNQAEYPATDQPSVEPGEVERDLPKVREIVEAASRVLDQMSPY